MLRTRVMPCLLLRNRGLVKTVRFRNPTYVGDPINTVRIYNQMEVDELIFLDITATREGKEPQFKLIAEIASECFMPFSYGGGVRSIEHIARLHQLGAEKVAINSCAEDAPDLITEAARRYGSQAVIVSMDVHRRFFGRYAVHTRGGTRNTGIDPVTWAKRAEDAGAGEILLTSIDQDGTFAGYDTELIAQVAAAVGVPVIACGGAGRAQHFTDAVNAGASAVAAGSMVVFQGPNRAVLINFPSRAELEAVLP
jgi:imidazole glycerol-phosphate synthase subunit HisF